MKAELDISNYILAEGVKMKDIDLSGFRKDDTDLKIHSSKPDFKIEVPIAIIPSNKINCDYKIEEMTAEQLEVFEALNYEGDYADYEELEDDFVLIANDGEVPLKSKEVKTEVAEDIKMAIEKEKQKKQKFDGNLFTIEEDKVTEKKKL